MDTNKFYTVANYYIEKYKTFCFSIKVRTDIKDIYQRVDGDYGLILTLPCKIGDNEYNKEITFDISK